jgi:predicted small secreted protein
VADAERWLCLRRDVQAYFEPAAVSDHDFERQRRVEHVQQDGLMMLRRLLMVGAVVAAAGLLSGCGNGASAGDGETHEGTPAPLTSVGPTGDPSSSYWTDERMETVEPEHMPTVG